MLQDVADLRETCQRANMFKKTLGFMEIIVCKIPPGGGAKPYLSYGLIAVD